MDLFRLIETNSFSSVWFWILTAVAWSSASHWILGVPSDLVQRARNEGGEVQDRVQQLLRINIARIKNIQKTAGLAMSTLVSFFLTGCLLLGFVYRIEFFQAVFLLTFPMVFVGWFSLRTARKIDAEMPEGEELYKIFRRLRLTIQFIGLFSITITSMWACFTS
ncbi:MAG: component of SufBCD complex [Paracoccaceae bacterium]|nr:component of SufBCD complex [Paracoccaceae bacterium]